MSSPIELSGVPSPAAVAAKAGSDPKKTKDAAQQFEAILIQQMLKSAHSAGGGSWMGEDETGSPMSDLAEQQFAQMLATNGGMGLATLVKQGLERK